MRKLNAMLPPLILRPLIYFILLMLAACDNNVGLSRDQAAAVDKAHVDARNRCSAKWYGQPRVPVRGSDFVLDATKLPWEMGGELWSEDVDCGAAQINATFYWTGKEILPQRIGMYPQQEYNVKPIDVRETWTQIQVAALLGRGTQSIRNQAQHPENYQYTPPQRPKSWPAEQLIRLKHYPDLEVLLWSKEERDVAIKKMGEHPSLHYFTFVLHQWPHDDGSARTMTCHMGEQNVLTMTREEIENLDLRQQLRHSCQMDFHNFGFNSGSAKVNWGTTQLSEITPALRALQQYFNDSITKE